MEITILVPDTLDALINTSRFADRIATASRFIIRQCYLAGDCYRITSSLIEESAQSIIGFRTKRFYEANPAWKPTRENGYSYAGELFYEETIRAFGFKDSNQNKKAMLEVIAGGERLGLWKYFPPGKNAGRDGNKKFHEPARMVLLGTWWRNPRFVPYEKELKKPVIKALTESEEDNLKLRLKNANDVIMAAHSDFARVVTLPTSGEVHEEAKRLASTGYKNKSGMVCVYDEHTGTGPDLAIQANYFACSDFKKEREYSTAKTTKGEEFSSRRYTTFSLCYSWVRPLMKVNGEKIVGIDCTALHPNIIAAECEKRGIKCEFLKGDTHTKVAELLEITRDEAKQINLMFFNWDKASFIPGTRGVLLRKFRDFMERSHKGVLEIIEELNKMYSFLDYKGNEVDGHANLSRLLFAEESLIMGEVIRQLRTLNITCNQSYDAVFVPESKKAIAAAIFNEVLRVRGISTTAK